MICRRTHPGAETVCGTLPRWSDHPDVAALAGAAPQLQDEANGLFTAFKSSVLGAAHDLDTHGVRAILIDNADDDPSLAADDFLDDIAAGGRVAVSADLGSPTLTGGTFDTGDFSFTSVTGDQSEEITIYNHGMGGSDAARGLIATYDTGVTGLPVTPNGGNINVTVNGSGWFSL